MSPGVVDRALHIRSLTAGMASDRSPDVVADEQLVRLRRALRAGRVLGDALAALRPRADDRVDDPPLRLDLVVAGEERGVAAHGVEDQPLVRLRRLRQERRAVEEL